MPLADVIAINYSRDVGWAGAIRAELCREEPSSVDVTFNYDGGPEIGTWQRTLLPDEFKSILALVNRSGYITIAQPAASSPEQKFLSVGERREGDALPGISVFEVGTLHPALSALSVEVERFLAGHSAAPLEGHSCRRRVGQANLRRLGSSRDPDGHR